MNLPISFESALVWFRRDLRDYDHAALAAALSSARYVYCTFVFDQEILAPLLEGSLLQDRRVTFIHASLRELDTQLRARGGGLIVLCGKARDEIPLLAKQLSVQAVFANRDYEPQAKARDDAVEQKLAQDAIRFYQFKDQAIFDGDEILTAAGKPFSVFTPYSRAWHRRLVQVGVTAFNSSGPLTPAPSALPIPELASLGFQPASLADSGLRPGMSGAQFTRRMFMKHLAQYADNRNFPARAATSGLSPHLRFGTLSIRELVAQVWQDAGSGAQCWLNELIWRDFYFQILDHSPHVVSTAYKPAFDRIRWDNWPEGFNAWKAGQTGYPLIDAGMRQLERTGTLHNRLRMVTASFLCKDLGIDWRLGEAHFAQVLNDFDLAANNGGWQWAASTGCDAQPWFRIFNPVTQSEKFDPNGAFIRQHIPELARVPDRYIHAPWKMPDTIQSACRTRIGVDYPHPIVDHEKARQITLARYKAASG